jgi:hypothetical protein
MRGPEKAALRSGMEVFDEIIGDELNTSATPGAQADLARYQGLTGPYSSFKQVSKAANGHGPTAGSSRLDEELRRRSGFAARNLDDPVQVAGSDPLRRGQPPSCPVFVEAYGRVVRPA